MPPVTIMTPGGVELSVADLNALITELDAANLGNLAQKIDDVKSAVAAGGTARVTGSILGADGNVGGTDWAPLWALSALINTLQRQDYAVNPAGAAAKHKFDVMNMSLVSALAGSLYNEEVSFGAGETRQAKLLDFTVPAAVGAIIDTCEVIWSSNGGIANVTTTADGTLKKVGTYGSKNVVAAGFATGLIAYNAITSVNVTPYTRLYAWLYSDIDCAAGQIQFLLDDTIGCASPLETINCPALVGGVWQRVRLQLANPQTDLAIISIGLKLTADLGAQTIAVDDVTLVSPGSKAIPVNYLFNGCANARLTLQNATAVDALNTLQAYVRLREGV
jgi:hypothetical protein